MRSVQLDAARDKRPDQDSCLCDVFQHLVDEGVVLLNTILVNFATVAGQTLELVRGQQTRALDTITGLGGCVLVAFVPKDASSQVLLLQGEVEMRSLAVVDLGQVHGLLAAQRDWGHLDFPCNRVEVIGPDRYLVFLLFYELVLQHGKEILIVICEVTTVNCPFQVQNFFL